MTPRQPCAPSLTPPTSVTKLNCCLRWPTASNDTSSRTGPSSPTRWPGPGPAARAGFKPGDRVVRVNGVVVRSQEEFYETLWRHRAGDVITVSVQRHERVVDISVQSVDRHRALTGPGR